MTLGALPTLASTHTSRSFVARGRPCTPTAYAPTTRNRTSAPNNARNRSRKSGLIACLRIGECVELEAQLPNDLGALVDGDPVPKQSVCIRFLFLLPQPKDSNFGTGSCRLPAFGIEGGSAHCLMIPRPSTGKPTRVFGWIRRQASNEPRQMARGTGDSYRRHVFDSTRTGRRPSCRNPNADRVEVGACIAQRALPDARAHSTASPAFASTSGSPARSDAGLFLRAG